MFIAETFTSLQGEGVLVEGRWQNHKRYGRQFTVDRYSTTAPPTLVGMERYLSSKLIEGVGPEFARRIVRKFGENTLDIIDNNGCPRNFPGLFTITEPEDITALLNSFKDVSNRFHRKLARHARRL